MASGNANVGVLGVLLFICCLSFARAHSGQVLTSILTQAFKPQKGWRYARWPWMPLDESGQNHLICVHKLTLKFLFQLCTNHTRFFSKIKRPAATLSVQGPMTYEVTWLSNFKSSHAVLVHRFERRIPQTAPACREEEHWQNKGSGDTCLKNTFP